MVYPERAAPLAEGLARRAGMTPAELARGVIAVVTSSLKRLKSRRATRAGFPISFFKGTFSSFAMPSTSS